MISSVASNRLLSSLSPGSRQKLESRLEAVSLPVGTRLYEPGGVPQSAYFLTSGLASVVTDMKDGTRVEVGLFGCEALPGSIRLLGAQEGATLCFMQAPGTGLRIGFRQLHELFHSDPELHARILQHVQYEAFTLAQLAACNRVHEAEERLARWLLMAADRLESDTLELTQEFLSEMLATRRSTVTITAGTLQKAGLIEYHRGRVQIRDHEQLENAACECYSLMRRLQKNLFADLVQV